MSIAYQNFPLKLPTAIVITDKELLAKIFLILYPYGFIWNNGKELDHYLTFNTEIVAIYLSEKKLLTYTSGGHYTRSIFTEYTDVDFLGLNL